MISLGYSFFSQLADSFELKILGELSIYKNVNLTARRPSMFGGDFSRDGFTAETLN